MKIRKSGKHISRHILGHLYPGIGTVNSKNCIYFTATCKVGVYTDRGVCLSFLPSVIQRDKHLLSIAPPTQLNDKSFTEPLLHITIVHLLFYWFPTGFSQGDFRFALRPSIHPSMRQSICQSGKKLFSTLYFLFVRLPWWVIDQVYISFGFNYFVWVMALELWKNYRNLSLSHFFSKC